jgi:hypothetical protein
MNIAVPAVESAKEQAVRERLQGVLAPGETLLEFG